MMSLQCLRALAALMVVYFHATLQLKVVAPVHFADFVAVGQSGVDIFFVISGYIMWVSTAGKLSSPLDFYKRRIARIVPLYWTFTLAAAAVALAAPSLLRSTQFDFWHVLASLFFVPWPNPAPATKMFLSPIIVPGWSLNYEAFFYLIFGLALLSPPSKRPWAIGALFALVLTALALFGDRSTQLSFYDPLLICEFLLGVALAVLVTNRPKLWAAPAHCWLIGCTAFALLIYFELHPPATPRLIYQGLPSAVIVISFALIDLQGRWPKLSALELLGSASYSLYLSHIFTLAFLRNVWRQFGFTTDTAVYATLFMIAAMSVSVLVGVLTFKLVERPLNERMRRALSV